MIIRTENLVCESGLNLSNLYQHLRLSVNQNMSSVLVTGEPRVACKFLEGI
jgi:hypothetical protein